jgi:hypothetical protein
VKAIEQAHLIDVGFHIDAGKFNRATSSDTCLWRAAMGWLDGNNAAVVF